jgi:hypothetical protein
MTAAARYTRDTLLIIVPLCVMMYFLFDPPGTAWLVRVL